MTIARVGLGLGLGLSVYDWVLVCTTTSVGLILLDVHVYRCAIVSWLHSLHYTYMYIVELHVSSLDKSVIYKMFPLQQETHI